MKNKTVFIIIMVVVGFIGIYLTFLNDKTKNYDRSTIAYEIEENAKYDMDDDEVYNPIYYYKVHGKEYICDSRTTSTKYPDSSKNKVYYDSTNPSN